MTKKTTGEDILKKDIVKHVISRHVTIDNVWDWMTPTPSSNALILEELADKIADLLNGNYTIAQLRNAILNDKKEIG